MTMSDYANIDGTHMMGQVIVSALRESQGVARSRNSFQCKQLVHIKRNCLMGNGTINQLQGIPSCLPKMPKGGSLG